MASHSNWPSDFVELKKLEDILQCSICYEYIDTCMITSCSHNFCSLCIRKYLQFKTQCPTCFEEAHGSDLRKNRLVDDVITIWVKLKDLILFNIRLATMTQSVKVESKVFNDADTPKQKNTKKESKSTKKELVTPMSERSKKPVVQSLFREKRTTPESTETKPIVVDGVVIPSIFQPQKSPKKNTTKKPEDMSICPVCNVDIPLRNLNMHLDSCLAVSEPGSSRLKPKPEKRDPIPKRVYTLMKEKDLKKCLKEHGLNANGDRKSMITRLTRYNVLYNAECDKELPRPVSEILKQVEREERDEKATQSNPLFQSAKPPSIPLDKKKDPEAIEKANKDYLDIHKDNFKKLIENMRARDGKNIKPLKPLNRIDSDDENEAEASTSGFQPPSNDKIANSIYNEDTIMCSSDSEVESPVKSEIKTNGPSLIDWDKTQVNEESEFDTQILENKPEVNSVVVLEDDESNSYDSVFNTSVMSESAKTPKSALSNSARKRTKGVVTSADSPSTTKIDQKFAEIFDSDNENSVLDKTASEIVEGDNEEKDQIVSSEESEEEDSEESDVDNGDESYSASILSTPAKNYDVSPEISPMKTRSTNKRKSQNLEEKTSSPSSDSRLTRRKKMKPSASPVY